MNPIEKILGKKIVKDKWSHNLAPANPSSGAFGNTSNVGVPITQQPSPLIQRGSSSTSQRLQERDYFGTSKMVRDAQGQRMVIFKNRR